MRSIEVVLGLEVLRRRAPEMARRELREGPFGSDVMRASMVPAAEAHGELPHRVASEGGVADTAGIRAGVARGDAVATSPAAGDPAGVGRQR